ncbi:uncharacterized protein LAESUDRAFT_760370 [Laetiporus sulphureus 93-53]|uniref:Uncharacterized protein n=1 Tax=Laetiporus sulphureus 93-53 TaxID=1314785 RepID=A0A165DM87_9APHY|nr:uncharacterized protein LAESUDRAFT_760370 [Laetiporus sulphureus 93-53]KZT05186.1 hypothetical protein LAESUDRAFT_760370 [Laetiporus sulphureus 93-53]
MSGLFKLDIDDDIWQDIDLDDDETSAEVPCWLGDETVHAGIKAMLVLDCCMEEEMSLCEERYAMQEWLNEERECIQHARHHAAEATDHNMAQVYTIPSDRPMPACWGSLERELLDAAIYEAVGQWNEGGAGAETLSVADEDDDDMLCDFGDLGGDDQEDELLDALESVALSDAYHSNDFLDIMSSAVGNEGLESDLHLSNETWSPRKWRFVD